MNSDTFPVLETKRLRLRKPLAEDIDRIITYADNPKVEAMTLSFPYPYHEADAIRWVYRANKGFEDGSQFIFAICKRSTDEFMGGIGLHLQQEFNRAEMGFWLGEPFWSAGYMTEAVQKVLTFGFSELELNKIYAIHFLDNPASGKVMARNGMVKEGELKEHIKKGEKYKSVIQYRMTRKEFEEI